MARLAIGGLAHETVTFLPEETTLEDFAPNIARGGEIIEAFSGSNTVYGGFIDVCRARGVEIEGLITAECAPSGLISEPAFDILAEELLSRAVSWREETDGLLLHLHGAMAVRGDQDPEQTLLRRLRRALGDDYPIAVAMDLHGNVAAEKCALAGIVCGYRSSPHTDMAETGERAASLLLRQLQGEINPIKAIARPGLVLPSIFTATDLAPLSEIMAEVRAAPASPGLLDATLFTGFAYADVAAIGATILVIADGDEALAITAAERLCERMVEMRQQLYRPVELFTAKSALDRAAALVGDNRRPVVILEHADRANDSTHVLHEALASGIGRIAVPYLCDPIAAKAAASAGVGNQLMTTLGGKSSELAGGPVLVSGIVRQAGPVRYRITGDFRKGAELDLGLCAVIDTGAVTIIVTTQNVTAVDTDPFSQFGLDIDEYDIIVLRSKTHFRAAYEPIAADILIADTPDWGPADLTTLPYRNAPPGIFPITV